MRKLLAWWRNRPPFFDRSRAEYIDGVGWPIINDLDAALVKAGYHKVSCEDVEWVLHRYHWHRGNDQGFINAMLQETLLTNG